MPRFECAHESDVLTMVQTGRWPERMPAELREHVMTCDVCADVAAAAAAIGEEHATDPQPALPTAGTMWWRAQIRARQDAAKEVVRPITISHAIGLAVAGVVAGAVFGASTSWFQHLLQRVGGAFRETVGAVRLSSILPSDPLAFLSANAPVIAIIGLGLVIAPMVVYWAFKEDRES